MGKRLARWYTVPGPLYSRRPMQLSLSHTCKQALKHIVGVACGNRAYRTIIVFPLLIRISVHASAALVCCLDLGGLSLNFWEKRWPIDLRFQKVHHEKLTRMAGKSRFFIHGCFLPSRGYLHLDYFSRFMLFFCDHLPYKHPTTSCCITDRCVFSNTTKATCGSINVYNVSGLTVPMRLGTW